MPDTRPDDALDRGPLKLSLSRPDERLVALAILAAMPLEVRRELIGAIDRKIAKDGDDPNAVYQVRIAAPSDPEQARAEEAQANHNLREIRKFGWEGFLRRRHGGAWERASRRVGRTRSSHARQPGHRRVRSTRGPPEDEDPPADITATRAEALSFPGLAADLGGEL